MVLQEVAVYYASLGNPNDPILKENVSALLPDDEKLLEWLKVMIGQISDFFSISNIRPTGYPPLKVLYR